jgi:hypothetical protein
MTDDSVIKRIQGLLNLAAKAGTPEEAALATAKAQELLAKYNLTSEAVVNASTTDGRREEAKVEGGFWQWQRLLWDEVAELNFCFHWIQDYRTDGFKKVNYDTGWRGEWVKGVTYSKMEPRRVTKRRHVLIGKVVNVRATIVLAQYLEQAVDRILNERTREDIEGSFKKWGHSFRMGAAMSICERLAADRQTQLREETRAHRKQAREAMGTATRGTALTLSTLSKTERDANIDFVYGDGTSARWAAERAQRAAWLEMDDAQRTAWAAQHPAEAAAHAERDRAARRSRGGGRDTSFDNLDWSAYKAGEAAASRVSLRLQVDDGKKTKVGAR